MCRRCYSTFVTGNLLRLTELLYITIFLSCSILVNDQGSANRKVAATNMNSESSRSHSLFTCTIESKWERDSVKYFRFSRLNLVDLAGSER